MKILTTPSFSRIKVGVDMIKDMGERKGWDNGDRKDKRRNEGEEGIERGNPLSTFHTHKKENGLLISTSEYDRILIESGNCRCCTGKVI